MSKAEQRLSAAGLPLTEVVPPVASYVPAVRTGSLVYVSGQGPKRGGRFAYQGIVGDTVSEEQAHDAARICAVNCLAALKSEIGNLDRVTRVVKMLGFIASAPGFERQPFVLNGASDVMTIAFEEAGRHARSAIGTSKLPFDIPVEVEVIFEVREA